MSFRGKYLEKSSAKQLAQTVVKAELMKHPEKISSVKIKKVY